ncbi:MAG: FAD-dependent oxidoreductase [Eubacteriales bacterium]|nr:FAD-dependent oxidoreductase [Eubacteriales bacterium]
MEKVIEHCDVVVIGGGAAGMTAGIYCGRARLKTQIIEKALVGGQTAHANEIKNYPGFPEGSTGMSLMELFHKQAKMFGVKFRLTDVRAINLEGEDKVVETFCNEFHCKVVIIASGGKPRLTGALNEEKYLYGKGISFCATCDAAANTGKTVMVIGSGDAAIEEGIFLTKFASKVIVSVLHDEGVMDCNEIAKSEALQNDKMEFLWNTTAAEFKGDDHLHAVALKNSKTGEIVDVPVDTCFVFIGYLPNTELFRDMVDMTCDGYVLTNERMETKIPGVFCAGDVRDKFLRQVATAVSDGAIAGYAAERYIAESEMFKNQIMGEAPRLVYLYNATSKDDRELLSILEKYEQSHCDLLFIKADVYKSNGIAQRLNVGETPCVTYIKGNQIVGCVSCGDICPTALDDLLKR